MHDLVLKNVVLKVETKVSKNGNQYQVLTCTVDGATLYLGFVPPELKVYLKIKERG